MRKLWSIGTRSVLLGAHCFAVHPVFVLIAWTKLYGFPTDWRLYVLFFVHDLGYLGKSSIDGADGKQHPRLGAEIMHRFFDSNRVHEFLYGDSYCMKCHEHSGDIHQFKLFCSSTFWRDLALFHSRDFARMYNRPISRLCIADKYATALTPAWIYLPMAWFTGELKEYMPNALKSDSLHFLQFRETRKARDWYRGLRAHLLEWVRTARSNVRVDLPIKERV